MMRRERLWRSMGGVPRRLERGFDVFEDGEPREKARNSEDNGNVGDSSRLADRASKRRPRWREKDPSACEASGLAAAEAPSSVMIWPG